MYKLIRKMLKNFKYRKIKKKIIYFINYKDIIYLDDRILIILNDTLLYKYFDWGEIDGNIIRIRHHKMLPEIHNDLKFLYDKKKIRKLKFKKLDF